MADNPAAETQITHDDINEAFDKGLFFVVYQAQVSLADTQKVFGLEAFVRLQHPSQGVLGPQRFFALVESMGLAMELTEIVLEQVCKHWAFLKAAGYDLRFAVNIEGYLIKDRQFLKIVEICLAAYGMPKQALAFEICNCTSDVINNTLRQNLLNLHLSGFSLSLNDFEDTDNVISMLKELPIEEIKVKTDVTLNLKDRAQAQSTFRKAIYLSQQYGLRVVAVGIEHIFEAEWLQRHGCDRGQGYLFGEPMIIDGVIKYLSGDAKSQTRQKHSLKLLIVEDDKQYQTLLAQSLGDIYQVFLAETVAEGKAKFLQEKPELMILDVNLPDGTGIELCQELNQHAPGQYSAIFVSGSRDPQHKLQAYEAGAIDFLDKPCPFSQLVVKMGHVATFHNRRNELEESHSEAHDVAVQSLREASYYGNIIHFFRSLLSCRDEESMAQAAFSYMRKKDLSCAIQFRNKDTISSFSQQDFYCSPIEMNVFELLHHKGRVHEFGERTIFNDQGVSILIKTMPEDEEVRGRIRDYIAVIVEGIEARYKDILRHRVLQTVFQQMQELAADLVDAVTHEIVSKNELVDKFTSELSMSFHDLHLTVVQEERFNKIIETMLAEQEDCEVGSFSVHQRISYIMSVLASALESLSVDPEENSIDFDNKVELF